MVLHRPIESTVFIGPNNSGKSSIFQSLLLWRQAASRNESHLCIGWKKGSEPYVFTEDQLVDIGEFEQVVRRKEREVSIGVSGSYPPDKNIEYGPGPTHGDFEIRVRENNLVYQHGELDCEVASFDFRGRVKWDRTAGQSARQFNLPVPVKNVTLNFNPVDALSLLGGTGYTFQGSLTPEEGVAFQELSNRLGQSVRKLLGSIHPVFPLRGFEQVGYPLPDAPAENLDRMALADRTMALLSLLAYNRDIEHKLSEWLNDLVGIRIETKLLPGKRVQFLLRPSVSVARVRCFRMKGLGQASSLSSWCQ